MLLLFNVKWEMAVQMKRRQSASVKKVKQLLQMHAYTIPRYVCTVDVGDTSINVEGRYGQTVAVCFLERQSSSGGSPHPTFQGFRSGNI